MKKIINLEFSRKNDKKLLSINDSQNTVSVFFLINLIKFGFYEDTVELSKKIERKEKIFLSNIDESFKDTVTFIRDNNVFDKLLETDEADYWIEYTLLESFLNYVKVNEEFKDIEFNIKVIDKYVNNKIVINNKALSSLIGMCSKFHFRLMNNRERAFLGYIQNQLILNDKKLEDNSLLEIIETLTRVSNDKTIKYQSFVNKTLYVLKNHY